MPGCPAARVDHPLVSVVVVVFDHSEPALSQDVVVLPPGTTNSAEARPSRPGRAVAAAGSAVPADVAHVAPHQGLPT